MTPIIELRNISKFFGAGAEQVTAVDDVSLSINAGEIVCLVGESGCGKSTTGRMVVGLLPPSEGQILYNGQNLADMSRADYKEYRRGPVIDEAQIDGRQSYSKL